MYIPGVYQSKFSRFSNWSNKFGNIWSYDLDKRHSSCWDSFFRKAFGAVINVFREGRPWNTHDSLVRRTKLKFSFSNTLCMLHPLLFPRVFCLKYTFLMKLAKFDNLFQAKREALCYQRFIRTPKWVIHTSEIWWKTFLMSWVFASQAIYVPLPKANWRKSTAYIFSLFLFRSCENCYTTL